MNANTAMSKLSGWWVRLTGRPTATIHQNITKAVAAGAMTPNEARALWLLNTPPTAAEVQQALTWLHGTRTARRKFERARFHLTYKQRDEIAHVVVRMSRAMEDANHESQA